MPGVDVSQRDLSPAEAADIANEDDELCEKKAIAAEEQVYAANREFLLGREEQQALAASVLCGSVSAGKASLPEISADTVRGLVRDFLPAPSRRVQALSRSLRKRGFHAPKSRSCVSCTLLSEFGASSYHRARKKRTILLFLVNEKTRLGVCCAMGGV